MSESSHILDPAEKGVVISGDANPARRKGCNKLNICARQPQ